MASARLFCYATFYECPPPATWSFAEAFSALNVQMKPNDDGESFLALKDLPAEQELSAKHFVGLGSLTSLSISSSSQPLPYAKDGLLVGLQNLCDLTIAGVALSISELGHHLALHPLSLIVMCNYQNKCCSQYQKTCAT